MSTEPVTRRYAAYPPEEWVDRFGDQLIRYAAARLPSRTAAEDAVQETMVKAIGQFDSYTGKGPLKAWLFTILKRQIVQYYRDQAAQREEPVGDQLDWDQANEWFDAQGNWRNDPFQQSIEPDLPIQQRELWRIVLDCLKQLPPTQADAFTLNVMEAMEAEQVCRELNISENNLRTRVYRARMQLARCVNEKWD